MTPPPGDWLAPSVRAPIDAVVELPGSKSLTNRYLVLAALASGPSRLRRPLRSRDTELMVQALGRLGVGIHDGEAFDWLVEPSTLRGPAEVDCGLAGTVMRFLPTAAALAYGRVSFDGDAQARRRPVAPVLDALRHLGVRVEDRGRRALPFVIDGRGTVEGGAVTLDASQSSQFVSALLLAGARYERGVTVHHVGKPVPSLPHISMTVEVLRDAGVMVDDSEVNTWRVEPSEIHALDVTVEPDLSNAAAFLAAAMVTAGRVRVPGWPRLTTQPGADVRELFEKQGARATLGRGGLTLTGPTRVRGVDVDLRDASELTPTVAAVACFADSPTWIRGVGHIRGHETDRIAALVTEIRRLGGDAEELDDGLVIRPATLHSARVRTYGDHRMATFGAIVGLVVTGVVVENVATTAKTLPTFVADWSRMVAAA